MVNEVLETKFGERARFWDYISPRALQLVTRYLLPYELYMVPVVRRRELWYNPEDYTIRLTACSTQRLASLMNFRFLNACNAAYNHLRTWHFIISWRSYPLIPWHLQTTCAKQHSTYDPTTALLLQPMLSLLSSRLSFAGLNGGSSLHSYDCRTLLW